MRAAMTTTSIKFTQKLFAKAAVLFLLAQVLWLPQMNPAAAQSTPAGPSATDFASLLTQWSPSQTDNGWWPALSSDGRYVAYGNWGESWVTDLQTGQNWDFRNPPGLDGVYRCIAGQWIKSDTLTFVCELDVDGRGGFARYEVKVGEWVPVRTSDNPTLVLANTFMAKDGHWASYIAGTRIVKDNQVIASQRPGGLMALSENMLVHACNNANVTICVVRDRERIKTYPARTPLFGADMYKNFIAYGGYGPVHGIEPSGLDVDLSAIRGFRESVPKIVGVNNQPWVVTDPWNSASQFMLLRPWGERSSIVVNLQSVSFSVVHTPGKFTIAGNTDRGLLQVVTISDQSRRVDLCGEACRNAPLNPVDPGNGGGGGGSPAACDLESADPNALLQCQIDELENPAAPQYAPGEDPANPVVFPADGQAGVAAAYSAKNDSVLVAAGRLVSDNNRQIVGMMANAKTMEIAGAAFRIDGGTSSGSPKVVYSPDFEKYLVAWEDTRPCGVRCRSAYGRFISADGAPMGADFAINSNPAFLSDVAYDATNKKFLVLSDALGASLTLRTVDGEGRISAPVTVVQSFQYQGQAGIAYNSNNNEYWIAYAAVVSGNDTAAEDDRIMLARFNAETLQKVGSDVQLNATNPGRNRFSGAHIAYSPQGGAMVIWMEREREGVAGTWGRTVNDDATLSDEYAVITTGNNSLASTEGFSSSEVSYNPWTESFFVSSGDWEGNAWLTEIALSGSVYEHKLVISVQAPTALGPLWSKLLGIKTAIAAALGSFNITSATTPYGAATLASRNYTSVVGAKYSSMNAPTSSNQGPLTQYPRPQPGDLTAFPTLISKIYIWSLGVGGLLALLMTVIGAYSYMTAAGNAERASKGSEMIWASVVGLALLFGAYLLLSTINPELVNFRITSF